MRSHVLAIAFITAALACTGSAVQAASETVVVLDLSGSMDKDGKLEALQETMKLILTILNGRVHIVIFSDGATAFPPVDLTSSNARPAALARYSAFMARGGTNYMAVLGVVRQLSLPPETTVIFVSDGEPNQGGGPDVILPEVRGMRCRFHTIAIRASEQAKRLLADMAVARNGKALAAESGEELARHLISLAFDMNDYLVFTPQETIKEFKGTFGGGSVLALGYDAIPLVEGAPMGDPSLSVTAALPGEHVSVTRIELGRNSDLAIRLSSPRSARGRIGKVLTNGTERHIPEFPKPQDAQPQAGKPVELTSRKAPPQLDARGEVVPKRRPQVEFIARDAVTGKPLDRAIAVPDPGRDGDLRASVQMPGVVGGNVFFEQVERDGPFESVTRSPNYRLEFAKTRGLASPAGPTIDLGTHFASTGRVALGPVRIEALDGAGVEWQVEVDPLRGATTSLSLDASVSQIRPMPGHPAEVSLKTELGALSPGQYRGRITFRAPVVQKPFSVDLILTVAEPLNAVVIGTGRLQPGMMRIVKVKVTNMADRPVGHVELKGGAFQVDGGLIEVQPQPPRPITLSSKSERTLDVRLSVTAGVTARGRHRVSLRLLRDEAELTTLPIDVRIDEGGEPPLRCVPSPLAIRGTQEAIVTFTMTVRGASDAVLPDHVQVSGEGFKDAAGTEIDLAMDLKVEAPRTITSGRALTVRGRVLLPSVSGAYSGTLTVVSDLNGTIKVPVTVQVN